MTEAKYSKRWLTPEGRDLAAEVAFRLICNESLDGLDVGFVDGRYDLRGFQLPSPTVVNRLERDRAVVLVVDGIISIRRSHWRNLDLSFSRIPHLRFFDSQMANCHFDRAILRDWRLWGCDVTHSSFIGSDMRGSVISSVGAPNSWSGVRFENSDLRESSVEGGRFVDCVFASNNLAGVHFDGCKIESVEFIGEIKDARFDNREIPSQRPDSGPMKHVSFSGAALIDVDFLGCRFEHVTFPDECGLLVYSSYPAVARRQLELIAGDESPGARVLRAGLLNTLKLPGREDANGYFRRRDWEAFASPEIAAFAQGVLERAVEDVAVQTKRTKRTWAGPFGRRSDS